MQRQRYTRAAGHGAVLSLNIKTLSEPLWEEKRHVPQAREAFACPLSPSIPSLASLGIFAGSRGPPVKQATGSVTQWSGEQWQGK